MSNILSDEYISARIGMVNFINTAPIYEIWQETVDRPGWPVTEATPTELNRMLFSGDLDLGFISSHEYAANPDKYRILDGLSISATGDVGSVFLFSRVSPEKLSDCKILLSSHSQTSVNLLAIILEKFLGVTPIYESGLIANANLDSYDAVLAIGDEALRIASEGNFPVKRDLGRIWHEKTGLPFVFAVWAVREDFCSTNSGTVDEIHRELQRCLKTGLEDLKRISSLVAPRIPMSEDDCLRYFRGIEYDLDESKKKGLQLFIEYLVEMGNASPSSLPLKIYR